VITSCTLPAPVILRRGPLSVATQTNPPSSLQAMIPLGRNGQAVALHRRQEFH